MVKQTWVVNEEEKNRILNLHETATKKLYLLNEQDPFKKTIRSDAPKKNISLGAQTFPSGKFELKFLNKNAINTVLPQITEYFKEFPENQKINVQVSASESNVPNQAKFGVGELAEERGKTVTNYLRTILPKNANFLPVNNLGAVGPEWDEKLGKNYSGYTNSQTISVILSVEGGKLETIDCLVDLKIGLDYKREWCWSTPVGAEIGVMWKDEGKCHQCSEAKFILYANGIALTPVLNLDNGNDGGSREGSVTITKEQALLILKGKEQIVLSVGCYYDSCHADPAHLTITNNKGEKLFEGFLSHGGKELSKSPSYLTTLNKCGEVVDKKNVIPWTQPTEPGRKIFNKKYIWKFDDKNPIESYSQVYRAVDNNGIIKSPKFGAWNNVSWDDFKKYYRIKNREIEQIKEFIKNKPQ